jgi:CYTH domain-containing protein
MLQRSPGEGSYARVEREQRWLLRALPDDVTEPVEIEDLYFIGSTLRLRRMRAGSVLAYKLGQKVRAMPSSPECVSLTNMYLSQREFEFLRTLGGTSLRKTRWQWSPGRRTLSVDQFHGSIEGLVLVEVELTLDEPYLDDPPYAVNDVTDEDRFSGGRLAGLSAAEAEALLADAAELAHRRDSD